MVSGFDGVSRYSSFVFGRIAARQASMSSWRTKVTSMPKRCRMPNICRVAPKSSNAATTWSPARVRLITVAMIADMPEAVATQASPPSSAASRPWNAATVGLPARE